jgi:hypothetical protein
MSGIPVESQQCEAVGDRSAVCSLKRIGKRAAERVDPLVDIRARLPGQSRNVDRSDEERDMFVRHPRGRKKHDRLPERQSMKPRFLCEFTPGRLFKGLTRIDRARDDLDHHSTARGKMRANAELAQKDEVAARTVDWKHGSRTVCHKQFALEGSRHPAMMEPVDRIAAEAVMDDVIGQYLRALDSVGYRQRREVVIVLHWLTASCLMVSRSKAAAMSALV